MACQQPGRAERRLTHSLTHPHVDVVRRGRGGVKKDVGIPCVEVSVKLLRHGLQVHLLHAPDLQAGLLPRRLELFVENHGASTRWTGRERGKCWIDVEQFIEDSILTAVSYSTGGLNVLWQPILRFLMVIVCLFLSWLFPPEGWPKVTYSIARWKPNLVYIIKGQSSVV